MGCVRETYRAGAIRAFYSLLKQKKTYWGSACPFSFQIILFRRGITRVMNAPVADESVATWHASFPVLFNDMPKLSPLLLFLKTRIIWNSHKTNEKKTNNERETNATRSNIPELPAAHTTPAALGQWPITFYVLHTWGRETQQQLYSPNIVPLHPRAHLFTLNPRQIKCPDTIR